MYTYIYIYLRILGEIEVESNASSGDLACRILRDMEFQQAYWEKNLWIAAYMMVGALHQCALFEVCDLLLFH